LISRACFVALAVLVAAGAHAAEPKRWHTLSACRYVADKSNDGDNFLVQCGREKFHVRLYFVDAPETDADFPERVRQQYEYFGVTLDELTRAGARARDYVQALLGARPFVIYTRYSYAQGRSKNPRYYGLVHIDGRYLHQVLLAEGLARNKGTRIALAGQKARDHAKGLQTLEDRARLERRGVWGNHSPSRRVVKSPF
jgi:endonuclease YncB( thermonuclease family)